MACIMEGCSSLLSVSPQATIDMSPEASQEVLSV